MIRPRLREHGSFCWNSSDAFEDLGTYASYLREIDEWFFLAGLNARTSLPNQLTKPSIRRIAALNCRPVIAGADGRDMRDVSRADFRVIIDSRWYVGDQYAGARLGR